MGRLTGQVAIVTGAAQGIGAAYAKALAAEGARVMVADLLDGQTVVEIIRQQGGEALARKTDVTDERAVRALVTDTVAAFGQLDILVNNAAMFASITPKPFDQISAAEWDKVMAVNVRGSFHCAAAAIPEMRKQHYGKIINIASGTVFKGMPNLLHYVTSKGAILAFTRALAREVGADGICVNTLAPGLTASEGIVDQEKHWSAVRDIVVGSRAIKRDETPDDLIGALIFLASHDSDFMTGQCLVVDGGSVTH